MRSWKNVPIVVALVPCCPSCGAPTDNGRDRVIVRSTKRGRTQTRLQICKHCSTSYELKILPVAGKADQASAAKNKITADSSPAPKEPLPCFIAN